MLFNIPVISRPLVNLALSFGCTWLRKQTHLGKQKLHKLYSLTLFPGTNFRVLVSWGERVPVSSHWHSLCALCLLSCDTSFFGLPPTFASLVLPWSETFTSAWRNFLRKRVTIIGVLDSENVPKDFVVHMQTLEH